MKTWCVLCTGIRKQEEGNEGRKRGGGGVLLADMGNRESKIMKRTDVILGEERRRHLREKKNFSVFVSPVVPIRGATRRHI